MQIIPQISVLLQNTRRSFFIPFHLETLQRGVANSIAESVRKRVFHAIAGPQIAREADAPHNHGLNQNFDIKFRGGKVDF
jgi:hypothetical protein